MLLEEPIIFRLYVNAIEIISKLTIAWGLSETELLQLTRQGILNRLQKKQETEAAFNDMTCAFKNLWKDRDPTH